MYQSYSTSTFQKGPGDITQQMSRMDMGGSSYGSYPMLPSVPAAMQGPAVSKDHADLIDTNNKLMSMYKDMMNQHMDLMQEHQAALKQVKNEIQAVGAGAKAGAGMEQAVCLGVIRLDYDYPPAPGDIDSPKSFAYDVYYRVVPGLTFSICQSGKMTADVEENFKQAVDWLVSRGVSGITGDCGFMMYFQSLCRKVTTRPVFMSALAQLPAVTCGFSKHELILILTANAATLKPMRDLIKDECGVDPDERRYVIVGCGSVPGFEAVAEGGKVNVQKVTPGIIELTQRTLQEHPKIRAILLECTELPPYADALRQATRLPVYDAITCCNFFITGLQDNPLFGLNSWQKGWDGKQASYTFGANLDETNRGKLVNKIQG